MVLSTPRRRHLAGIASRLETGSAVEALSVILGMLYVLYVDANRLLVNGYLIYCVYMCVSLSLFTITTHTHKTYHTVQALGAGGILASSEWIYWETLSLIIGTFGTVPLSVHTIPTQVIMVTMMPALSWGIALAIRLGATLPVSVSRAQRLVRDCYAASVAVAILFAMLMYVGRYTIFHCFTTSEAVVAGADEIWWKVCLYFFLLCVYAVHMGTCTGLGLQWTLGMSTFLVLWIFGLPMAFYSSVTCSGGLNAAWTWVWPPYVVLNVYLAVVIVRVDWQDIAEQIRIREGMELIVTTTTTKRPSWLGVEVPCSDTHRHYGAIDPN